MQFLKVFCSQCAQYQQCPQKTRLFVNYCGSDRERVQQDIQNATKDCRARRGGLFSNGITIRLQPLPLIEAVQSQ